MGIEVYKPIETKEKLDNFEMTDFLDFDKSLESSFSKFLSTNKKASPEERQEWFNKWLGDATSALDRAKNEKVEEEVHGFKNKLKEFGKQMKDLSKKLLYNEDEENIERPELDPTKFSPDFVKYFDNIDVQNKEEFADILNNSEVLPLLDMDMIKNYALKNIQTYNSSGLTSSTQIESGLENKSGNIDNKNSLNIGENMILGNVDPNKQYFSSGNVKVVGSRLIYMGSDNLGKEEITVIIVDKDKKEISKKIFVIDIVGESIDNTPEAISSSGINPGDVGGENN